jgi:adenylate cyclase
MTIWNTVARAWWAIGNIGVTPDIRPEEAKHIQYFNIGTFLIVVLNIAFYAKDLPDEKSSIPALAQLVTAALCLLVYVFHKQGRYNLGRMYGFLIFYLENLVTCPLSGKEVVDHFFIFAAIAYAFLVFPKKEGGSLAVILILGVICYVVIQILYEYTEPIRPLDPSEIASKNRIILYTIFFAFTIFMIAGRNFVNKTEDLLMKERERLKEMADLLKKMFGQYLSTEVMNSFIEDPSALELGGEKRAVTIMMSDLRGFTFLSERMEPEQVVQMLNDYFEIMVEVALKYNGTICKFIGDGLLIFFGAPQDMPDRARRAVACAIEMQNAMEEVNERNRAQGLPELEMGIGVNESDVIVGNIGSSKRSSYSVVGSGVNMTSRIESYTVGGQILISESVHREAGDILRIDSHRDVLPKGFETPLRIYEVGGIAGDFNIALDRKTPVFVLMSVHIPLIFTVLEEKAVGGKLLEAAVVKLSKYSAEIMTGASIETLANVKMNLVEVDEKLAARDFYGKIVERSGEERKRYLVRFTALPPEVDAYFQALRQYAADQ